MNTDATGGAAPRAADTVRDVDTAGWADAIRQAREEQLRWAGLWADETDAGLVCMSCFVRGGRYLLLRVALDAAAPVAASHVPYFPAADRMERHARDLLGIEFRDHPDPRRWTRHQAWPADRFPLRAAQPAAGAPPECTPPDSDYPFTQAQGAAVCEIPVGPVHAGIIEPGHFRFQAVGEDILALEQRLGYTHKGVEKIAVGRDAAALARLAGRVSGDSTVGHTWAACLAMERAADVEVPPRAALLRGVMLECERVANHLGDTAAVCNDVAFTFAFYQFSRLREVWLRHQRAAFGHRLMMDRVVPGGIAASPDAAAVSALRREIQVLHGELADLRPILEDHPSLEDRLIGTGVLTPAAAARWGALGFVGRASGVDQDVRRDRPDAPYDTVTVTVPVAADGDVAARLKIRLDEVAVSLGLLEHWLARLAPGPDRAPWREPAPGAWGVGTVEGWRGEILTFVRFAAGGRIARFFPRDPSWFSWPLLEQLIQGNIVPEFPVCNKSVNGSYSGHDL